MKSYYYKLLHSKKTTYMILLIFIMPVIDILVLLQSFSIEHLMPHLSTFLSGSSNGHIMQIMLVWFLPIFLLIMCADGYIHDYKTGYRYVAAARKGRATYYRNMLFGNMTASFLVIIIALFVNLLLAYLMFRSGTNDTGLSPNLFPENKLYTFTAVYPFLSNVAYIFLFSIIASICAGACTVISWILPDIKYTYALCFVIWFAQILGMNSIAMLIQPFNELSLDKFFYILIRTVLVFALVIGTGFIYKVKHDEV